MSEVDVVVVGSGAGGLTAATVAAKNGLKVIVVEKTEYFGGTTAFSGGAIWVPNNRHMKELGITDSRAEAETYLRIVLGNYYDAEKIDAFLDNAPRMLDYMEDNTEAKFKPVPMPDYKPGKEGWKKSRSLLSVTYDNRKLGENAKRLRPQRKELVLFRGMQLEGSDIHQLRKVFKNWASFTYTTKLMVKYWTDRLRFGRTTRVVNGNALAGRLLRSAMDAGVDLRSNTKALDLVKEGGKVVGIEVEAGGKKEVIRVRKGVVLASGGFGANKEMRAKYIPMAEHHYSLQPEANVGDGLKIGEKAGGVINDSNPSNGIWTPVSVMKNPDGSQSLLPHIFLDRYMPGSISVDASGKRFVNEADSYQNFVDTMHQLKLTKVHMICDREFLRKYGLGLVRPFPFPIAKYIQNGYLFEAQTIKELATKIGVDPQALDETVNRYNEGARKGLDPEFKRGEDAFTQFRGDPDQKPNPSIAPIGEGPYYAIAMHPGDLSSVNGLNTNRHSQVLDQGGQPIDGLYAVGLDSNSMTRGMYPGGGASLGPAMTFGYVAARHLAGVAH